MGLDHVPSGWCAAVVTHLEMTTRPLPKPVPADVLRLLQWHAPDPEKYRALFRRVGAPWLWFTRLTMDVGQLSTIIADPGVKIFAVLDSGGLEIGIVELDFRTPPDCEIAYFGLIPELAGHGYGRWLMAQTLALAWAPGVERVWVHTCSLDHPSALGFYRMQGFVPFKREIETFRDPRLTGQLPRDAAPQIPLIGTS